MHISLARVAQNNNYSFIVIQNRFIVNEYINENKRIKERKN